MKKYFFFSKPGTKRMHTPIMAGSFAGAFVQSYYICKKEKVRLVSIHEAIQITDLTY